MPTELRLELSVWGEGSGKMSKRWKDVVCHYRPNTETTFRDVPMRIVKEEQKRILFSCHLPAITDPDVASVTYYFDEKFDGHYNKQDERTLPIRRPHNRSQSDLAAALVGTTWEWHQPSTLRFEDDSSCILSPWRGGERHTWKAISGDTIEIQSAASPSGWNHRYQVRFSDELTRGTTFLYNAREQQFHPYSDRLRRINP